MKISQDLFQSPLTQFCEMCQKVQLLFISLDFSPQNGKSRGFASVRHPESDVWYSHMRMNINLINPYWTVLDALSNPVIECKDKYISISVLR